MLHKRDIQDPHTENFNDMTERRLSAFSSVQLHETDVVYATVIVTIHDLK